jgi:hypothetical protein
MENGSIICYSAAQFPDRHRRRNPFFGTSHIWVEGGYASDGVTPLNSMEIYCHVVPTPSEPPPPRGRVSPTPRPRPSPAQRP